MNEQPTHLDLFSGIGGFALAAGWAGFRTVGFCEIEPYAQAVLKKHWPQVPIHTDIRELRGGGQRIDLLTGGFPCQDISVGNTAGLGIYGKRSGLWVEMCRIIGETRPKYALVENSSNLLKRGLGGILWDLAEIGYDAEWNCIPATHFGAHHGRDRAWVVAYPKRVGWEKGATIGERIQKQRTHDKPNHGGSLRNESADSWPPEPGVGRVAYGIPNRTHRLKGLGNAIVPQVAYQIIKVIKEVMEQANEN
jgi:DNA (cytosine-5)-methyltransferase 1